MKKFCTVLMAALVAVSASAITVKPATKQAPKTARKSLTVKSLPQQFKATTCKIKKAPRKEEAAATPYLLAATYNGWFGDASYEGLAASVTSDGNNYIIDGLFTASGYEASIPMTRIGNVLTIDSTVVVCTIDYTEYDMGIVNMHYGELLIDADGNFTGAKQATLNIDENGTITTPNDTTLYGLYETDADGNFNAAWAYVYAITMSPVTEELNQVTLPEGAEPTDYLYTTNSLGTVTTVMSQAYTDGKDFYLYGLTDAWIKGTIEDGIVTFPTNQYLGSETGYYTFFYPATLGELDEETYTYPVTGVDALKLKLNEDGSLTSIDDTYAMTVTIAGEAISYCNGITVKPYLGDTPATPVDPYFIDYAFDSDTEGYNYIAYYTPNEGTNGEYLNPDKMYLRFWYDDEVYEFDPEVYYYDITEATTLIPWTQFTYNMYFGSAEQYLYLYDLMFQKIGVQVIYTVDGVENRSNIVYIDAEGNTSTTDGVNTVLAAKDQKIGYYDLNGRQMGTAPVKGLYIHNGKKVMR